MKCCLFSFLNGFSNIFTVRPHILERIQMQTITHPISKVGILGVRLPQGANLRSTDLYDSTDGTWRRADFWGDRLIYPGCTTIWVRQPAAPLSDHARALLDYVNRRSWGPETCIGKRGSSFYVIPNPTFNWDGRFDLMAMQVEHPECVQELIDHGYLISSMHDVMPSDYSMVPVGYKNEISILTDGWKDEVVK